jgi:hypothetical protein
MKIELEGGVFAGGKHTITMRKRHRTSIVNTATGVAYRLLFTAATTAAPTTAQPSTPTSSSAPAAG